MTPRQLIERRALPVRLVIFDCDGVLVDSEPISNRVIAAELAHLGWPLSPEESARRFLGRTLSSMVPEIEAQIRRALPERWKQVVMAWTMAAMAEEAAPVAGAIEALAGLDRLGLPWRVASNSSHEEMRVKFARLGISALVEGRVHSHRDVGRAKPAPDLFLAAAAAEGVAAADCIVVEDSETGVAAAMAAGMDCLGYAPVTGEARLRAAGAVPFHSMFELPALLRPAGVAA